MWNHTMQKGVDIKSYWQIQKAKIEYKHFQLYEIITVQTVFDIILKSQIQTWSALLTSLSSLPLPSGSVGSAESNSPTSSVGGSSTSSSGAAHPAQYETDSGHNSIASSNFDSHSTSSKGSSNSPPPPVQRRQQQLIMSQSGEDQRRPSWKMLRQPFWISNEEKFSYPYSNVLIVKHLVAYYHGVCLNLSN